MSTHKSEIAGFDPEEFNLVKMEGYDDCILGVVERFGQTPIVCYDKDMVLSRLEDDGAEPWEAEEYFLFNQLGAWMGETTPCFLSRQTEQ